MANIFKLTVISVYKPPNTILYEELEEIFNRPKTARRTLKFKTVDIKFKLQQQRWQCPIPILSYKSNLNTRA